MKKTIIFLILIIVVMIWFIKFKETYNYNLFWYINIVDDCENTRKHEISHDIYKHLTEKEKIRFLYNINLEEFLWETYWSYISRELIRKDNLYNFQILLNKNKLQEELFAYYIQMK